MNTLKVKELARFFDEKPDEAVGAYSRVFGVFEQRYGREADLVETPALTQAFIDNHEEMARSFEKI